MLPARFLPLRLLSGRAKSLIDGITSMICTFRPDMENATSEPSTSVW